MLRIAKEARRLTTSLLFPLTPPFSSNTADPARADENYLRLNIPMLSAAMVTARKRAWAIAPPRRRHYWFYPQNMSIERRAEEVCREETRVRRSDRPADRPANHHVA